MDPCYTWHEIPVFMKVCEPPSDLTLAASASCSGVQGVDLSSLSWLILSAQPTGSAGNTCWILSDGTELLLRPAPPHVDMEYMLSPRRVAQCFGFIIRITDLDHAQL